MDLGTQLPRGQRGGVDLRARPLEVAGRGGRPRHDAPRSGFGGPRSPVPWGGGMEGPRGTTPQGREWWTHTERKGRNTIYTPHSHYKHLTKPPKEYFLSQNNTRTNTPKVFFYSAKTKKYRIKKIAKKWSLRFVVLSSWFLIIFYGCIFTRDNTYSFCTI